MELPESFNQSGGFFSKAVRVCDFCFSLEKQKKLPKTAIGMIQYRNNWLQGIIEGYADDYFCLGLNGLKNPPSVAEINVAYKSLASKFHRENNLDKVEEVTRAFKRLTGETEVNGQTITGPHHNAHLHYLLGLKEGFTEKERVKSFRKAALKYHPDKQANKSTPSDAINPNEDRHEYAARVFEVKCVQEREQEKTDNHPPHLPPRALTTLSPALLRGTQRYLACKTDC